MRRLRAKAYRSLFVLGLVGFAIPSHATPFFSDGVFASKTGSVREYRASGVFIQSLTSGLSGITAGSGFNAAGTLHVVDFSNNQIITFANNATNTQGVFGGGFTFSSPKDIRFDSADNVFISDLGGSGLRKFNSAGTAVLGTWAAGRRIDWFDIDNTQRILYYTDESGSIHRWDLVTNTALTDLCTDCGKFALRLLDNRTLLVANGTGGVNRVSTITGDITGNYLAGLGKQFFSVNLDQEGTTFWTGEFTTDDIYRVNYFFGTTRTIFNSGSTGNDLHGVSAFGERTQLKGGTVPEPATVLLLAPGLLALIAARKRLIH